MNEITYPAVKDFVSNLLFDTKIIFDKDPCWPKISIVTPSYNQAGFLEKTILSVLNQNYPNLEYIIIDGGSTDDSVEIIKKYEKYLAYWVSEPDKGQADAIDKGFKKSTGKILAWLNSDDFYLPGTFTKIAETFKSFDCDVVYGDEYLVDKDDLVIGQRCQLPFPKRLGLAFFVYDGFWVYQPASFWSKRIYDQVGGVDHNYRFAMDNDLFIRFAVNNAKFKYIKDHVVCFRFHDSSKTCTIRDVWARERQQQRIKYGNNVHRLFRHRFLMRNLGRLNLLRHLYYGNGAYLLNKFAYKTGLKKKHSLVP